MALPVVGAGAAKAGALAKGALIGTPARAAATGLGAGALLPEVGDALSGSFSIDPDPPEGRQTVDVGEFTQAQVDAGAREQEQGVALALLVGVIVLLIAAGSDLL